MLLHLFKALGFDIPARIDELRARVERRVEHATDQAKGAVQEAVITAALAAIALIAALAAIAVGLVALYRWVAQNYGAYPGYGVIGGILVIATIIPLVVIALRARSRSSLHAKHVPAETQTIDGQASTATSGADATPAAPARARGWSEVLTFVLPILIRSRASSALVGEVVGRLGGRAGGTARKALSGATNVVSGGDRINLVMAVSGAVLLGWFMARRARRDSNAKTR